MLWHLMEVDDGPASAVRIDYLVQKPALAIVNGGGLESGPVNRRLDVREVACNRSKCAARRDGAKSDDRAEAQHNEQQHHAAQEGDAGQTDQGDG